MKTIKVGDRIKVLRVPPDVQSSKHDEMRTLEVFESCVGKVFVVQSINEIGWLELQLDLPTLDSIWIEPEFVSSVE